MPRRYVRRGERGRWTSLQLQAALRAVKEQGLSISGASRKFGVPKSTLYNHYSGKLIHTKINTKYTTQLNLSNLL